MIDFCGLKLKNPLVIAASPATESVRNVKECANAGAGSVILKSMGPRKITQANDYCPRRMVFKDGTLYMQSSSRREILTVEEGINLIEECRKEIDIPIVSSVCGIYKNLEEWEDICKSAVGAGADMVQIDTIYCVGLSNYIDRTVFNDLVTMSENIQNKIEKPVIVKISPNIHVQVAAEILKKIKIGVSLLDSLSVGIPPDISSINYSSFRGIQQHGKCLAAGKVLFPLSLLYTQTLYRSGVGPICAGGGIFNANDALNLLMSGAKAVQIATSVCVFGFNIISKILSNLDKITNHYEDLDRLRMDFHRLIGNETKVVEGKVIRGDIECGECDNVPCESAIMCVNRDKGCEGCGICIDVCSLGRARFVGLKNNKNPQSLLDDNKSRIVSNHV